MTAGGAMDGHSGENINKQDTATFRCRSSVDVEIQPRLDAVLTDFRHEFRQPIQIHRLEWLWLSLVRNSQDKTPTAGVGKRRQLIGKIITSRGGNTAPSKLRFLQFETAVFT